MTPEELVQAVRPGIALRRREPGDGGADDETVLLGGDEVFRIPLTELAVVRQAVLVRALPALRPLVPVSVPQPRYIGVLADGTTPFTAERRLPGRHPEELGGIARGQLEGLLAALAAVPTREAGQWGLDGTGSLLHGDLTAEALLVDPERGVLTGVVAWRPRLGDPGADLLSLPPPLRPDLRA